MGLCRPVDRRPEKHLTLEGIQLDVIESFRNLGDEVCPEGGCELATIREPEQHGGSFMNYFLFLHPPQSL